MYTLSILLFLLTSSLHAALLPCSSDLPSGTSCQALVSSVRPTQPEVGFAEVKAKAKRYSKLSPNALQEKVAEKTAPLIIGPDANFYLTDRHHSLLAFSRAGVQTAQFRVLANWSTLGEGKALPERMRLFWDRMISRGYVWTLKENGLSVAPDSPEFPRSLQDCGNNRMRSVVYFLIRDGALTKPAVFYYEFKVAELFQQAGFRAPDGFVDEAVDELKRFLATQQGKDLIRNLNDSLGNPPPAPENRQSD